MYHHQEYMGRKNGGKKRCKKRQLLAVHGRVLWTITHTSTGYLKSTTNTCRHDKAWNSGPCLLPYPTLDDTGSQRIHYLHLKSSYLFLEQHRSQDFLSSATFFGPAPPAARPEIIPASQGRAKLYCCFLLSDQARQSPPAGDVFYKETIQEAFSSPLARTN